MIKLGNNIKDSRSGTKAKKGVTFPLGVLVQQVISTGEVEELGNLLVRNRNRAAEVRGPNGTPPILRAIQEKQMNCLNLLLAAGANILAQDTKKCNALHVASAMDNIDAAKMIVQTDRQQRGMTQSRNFDGNRPIDLAESLEMSRFLLYTDLAEFRLDCYMEGEKTSCTESESEILHLVRDYYEKHSDPLVVLGDVLYENTCYSSILHLAAAKNYSRLAYYVCAHSVPSLEVRDDEGCTPLHIAAYHNSVDMALFLVESGANIHTINYSYEKPADLATHPLILSIMEEPQIYME